MKIVLIASYYYPTTDVSSLRIHSYCKALVKKGHHVTVLMVYPVDKSPENGSYEGVNYAYLGNGKFYNGNYFSKIYYRLSGLYSIGKYIFTQNPDTVLSYHDNMLTSIFVKIFTVIKKLPYVIDKTEYPYGYFEMSTNKKLFTKLNLSLFDGFIVISEELKRFYLKFSDEVFLLPMTIDPNRFDHVTIYDEMVQQYVCLTFGVHNRDGLFDSIIAFQKYLSKSEKKLFKLFLIGDFSTLCDLFPENRKITTYIKKNELQEYVKFFGKLPIDEVPEILANAKCLITTPTKYSSGGFPTKIGEYMLSGSPVITTVAGEISLYLKHHYDALLCAVGDLNAVAENILYVEENPLSAALIGKNALMTAKTKFNASTYVDDLLNFINTIKK